ncbi:MAG: hypothetical protein AAFO93_02075 [Pseudomonadota bacterium]
MAHKIIRVEHVTFDAGSNAFTADVTLAAPEGPTRKHLRASGHRSWTAQQIVTALQAQAGHG